MNSDTTSSLEVVAADEADRDVMEHLWGMFSHDLSEHNRMVPNREGRFRQERLEAALSGEPGWAARLFRLGDSTIGFAVLRALDSSPHIINSFFLVHGVRRRGIGTTAVKRVVKERPGRWAVAFQDANEPASAFWRRLATSIDPSATPEHRSVPGRPELSPDTWFEFTVR